MKVRRLSTVTGGRCESCSNEFPPLLLQIHIIGNPPDIGAAGSDLQNYLLVLCPEYCRSFRSGRGEESLQRELVRHRAGKVRKLRREILGYHSKKIHPSPETSIPKSSFRKCSAAGRSINF